MDLKSNLLTEGLLVRIQPGEPFFLFFSQSVRDGFQVLVFGALKPNLVPCLWRIGRVAAKRSDPRNGLDIRAQTPNDFFEGCAKANRLAMATAVTI